jgi:D-alanyl-D-alanine carboxypeptidase (penicillin-binding protein 5/6)
VGTTLLRVKRRGWTARGLGLLGVSALLGLQLTSPAVAAPLPPEPLCAIGDLQPISVPTPSPLPVHKPGQIVLGGDELAGNGLAVAPGAPPLPTNLAATSWLVADLDTGEVIGACGAHRMLAPASVQKLLLVATVLPKLDPADTVVVTPEDMNFEPGSSAVGLITGGTYTVELLFLGLLLNSGNDTANTLARLGGGDRGVAGTLADMNDHARHLGAWDTHAETPSGLDGPGQVTSAYDLALIFRDCFAHDDFRRWLRTESAQMPPQPPRDPTGFAFQNDNRLLYEYPGALGGKTGFTDIARHTYVGAAERDGRRLVATVLGAEIMPVRAWQQAAGLLDWGFAQPKGTAVGHLIQPGEADRLLESRQREGPEPVVVRPGEAAPTDRPTTAVWLGGGIGVAALGSLVAIVVMARRRRASPAAVAPTAVATAAIAPTTAAPTAAAPSSAAPTPPLAEPAAPTPPSPEAPPRPLMGQPPPSD